MNKLFIFFFLMSTCLAAPLSANSYKSKIEDATIGAMVLTGTFVPLAAYEEFTHWINKGGASMPSFNTMKGLFLSNIAAQAAAATWGNSIRAYGNFNQYGMRSWISPAICAGISFITSKIANDRYDVSFNKSLPIALWMASIFYFTHNAMQMPSFDPC